MKITELSHQFVEYIPETVQDRTLYVSVKFATVVHKCCCGCGKEVVTPLSPTDWKLTYDGKTLSLSPSIGNWGFDCRSHYWIRGNRVIWAPRWSQDRIAAGRAYDMSTKEDYYGVPGAATDRFKKEKGAKAKRGLWQKLKDWLL